MSSWAARAAAAASAVPAASTIPSQLPTAPASAPMPAPTTGATGAYVPPWKRAQQGAAPAPAAPARACEGVALQPVRLADLPAAAPKAQNAGAYVPPSLRKAEEEKKPTTLNVDDARAFPTFAAPGRPAPVAAASLTASSLNFKKTIEERIVKDEEEAAALAKPKEEDPLKMTREELIADGWTVLDKPAGNFERRRAIADRLFARLATEAFNEQANEDMDSIYPDGRCAIYDASFEPYKSPIVQEQEAKVERITQRKQQGPSMLEILFQRRKEARARNGPGEAALWAAQGGAGGQIGSIFTAAGRCEDGTAVRLPLTEAPSGSSDAEASSEALRRHLAVTA